MIKLDVKNCGRIVVLPSVWLGTDLEVFGPICTWREFQSFCLDSFRFCCWNEWRLDYAAMCENA
jgi:hypothetical protein